MVQCVLLVNNGFCPCTLYKIWNLEFDYSVTMVSSSFLRKSLVRISFTYDSRLVKDVTKFQMATHHFKARSC